jgi:hypothetical protein
MGWAVVTAGGASQRLTSRSFALLRMTGAYRALSFSESSKLFDVDT